MISNVRSHPLTTTAQTPTKFTQKKIKISSQGLFFNNRDLEKKAPNIGNEKISFFRPFNSAFERESHTIAKQKRNFNKDAGMKATPFEAIVSREELRGKDRSRAIHSSVSGPLSNKYLDAACTEVISGMRALTKQKQLQNNGHVKRIFNGYIKGGEMQSRKSGKTYAKRSFVPFVDERDHLGQLRDSDIRTELGQSSYMRKLVSQPRAQNLVELREDAPRRWLERVGQSSEGAAHSARKSTYFDNKQMQAEYFSHGGREPEALSDEYRPQQFNQTTGKLAGQGSTHVQYLESKPEPILFDKGSRNYKTLVTVAKPAKDDKSNVETQADESEDKTSMPVRVMKTAGGKMTPSMKPAGSSRSKGAAFSVPRTRARNGQKPKTQTSDRLQIEEKIQ